MKLYFDSEGFDGQFGRTVGYSSAGGADIGECRATAATIKPGDADSWYDAWIKTGDRLYALAQTSRAAGHHASARSAFLRASNYYRNAYIMFFAVPVDPRVLTAYDKLTCPKKYVQFKATDGAGDHCEAGAGTLFAQTLFDWLDPILKP